MLKGLSKKLDEGDRSAPFSILFIDEVDKALSSGKFDGYIQAEMLRLLEGYPYALSSHAKESWQVAAGKTFEARQLLIILGGAFQSLEDSHREPAQCIGFEAGAIPVAPRPGIEDLVREGGMGSEFLGRMKAVVGMHPLSETALLRILENQRTSPLAGFDARLSLFWKTLTLTKEAKLLIARYAAPLALGARPLENTLSKIASLVERRIIANRPERSEAGAIRIHTKQVQAVLGKP